MIKKGFCIIAILFICCAGLILTGCSNKSYMKESPVVAEESVQEETPQGEISKKDFDESLVVKREPGIQGEVFESSLIRDIHFDFDRYDIRQEEAAILKENAALLNKFSSVKAQIEGHCDERGTAEYNIALGERRATSVKNYMVSLGISPDRLSTISYGEEKPFDSGHNEEAWTKNRRAHIVITSK